LPLARIGALAVDALCELMRGYPPRDLVVPDPLELVVRGSTAPPTLRAPPSRSLGIR
jgi:hypothetical protein